MSSPGSTNNPGQMLPVRMMAKCTDGGALDGKWVDIACTSSGQVQQANSTSDARSLAISAAFPAGSVTLAQGKIITAQSLSAVFPVYSTPFIIELINVIDKTHTGLDLDIYVDVSAAYGDWVGTVSEGNYAYAGALSASAVVGVCKVRNADYTTQYSAAATVATSVASKALVMSGSSSASSVALNIVVVSAGTSTATVTPGQLQIELVVRSKPLVSP